MVRSTTALSCRTPVWGLRHAAALTAIDIVRVLALLDGPVTTILFTNMTNVTGSTSDCLRFPQYGRCVFEFHHIWTRSGELATYDLPPSQPTVFSAAGGEQMMVSGMGFDAQRSYSCRVAFRYGPVVHAVAARCANCQSLDARLHRSRMEVLYLEERYLASNK